MVCLGVFAIFPGKSRSDALKLGSTDARYDIDESLVNVVQGGSIAIVIDVHFDESLWIQAESCKNVQENKLLPDGGIAHLQYGQEDLVEQDLDLFLWYGKFGQLLTTCNAERLALSFVRIPYSIRQKISQLSSNTLRTGLTAFLLKHSRRYCLIA